MRLPSWYGDEPSIVGFFIMKNEIWKEIPNTGGLNHASTLGRIKSVDHIRKGGHPDGRKYKGKILKLQKQGNGYMTACVKFNGKSGKQLVHRLIALTFIETDNTLLPVLHKNNNKTDNRVANLSWGTYKENVNNAFRDGLNKMCWDHSFSKYSADIYIQVFCMYKCKVTVASICRILNLPKSTVYNMIYNYEKYKNAVNKMIKNI